ncbi:MAG TPA: hypothetical protein C5S50_05360 [Methanosarcinaceae archaeon]|nr:hypothetical protein [Methanosarcinaceae archaeon]
MSIRNFTIFPAILLLLLLLLLFISVQSASAQDISIVNVYSDVDSADFTIHADKHYENIIVRSDLIFDSKIISSKQFNIDKISPDTDITKVVFWGIKPEAGYYHTEIAISLNSMDDGAVETKYSNFSYGRQAIPKIFIKDIVPDSMGISIILSPKVSTLGVEPVLADVEYMLVDGDTVVYQTKNNRINVIQATPLSKNWNIRLENDHEYLTRVKVKIASPIDVVIARSKEFTAKDDAKITELYRDETGASVTVLGQSQVPFTGSIVFTVVKDGNIIGEISEKSPILMSGDDDTIEVTWGSRLATGIYGLTVKVVGNDNDVLDRWDTIIEVEHHIFADETPAPIPAKESPGLSIYSTAFLIILVYLSGWADRRHW